MDNSTYDKTIEDRKATLKEKFIAALREIPIIEMACKKAGIGRTTHHRWIKEDTDFHRKTLDAMSEGRELINDMSEAQIIQLIKEKKLPAITLWLKHNNPRYGGKAIRGPAMAVPELTPQEEKLFRKALSLSAGTKQKRYAKNTQQNNTGNTGKSETS